MRNIFGALTLLLLQMPANATEDLRSLQRYCAMSGYFSGSRQYHLGSLAMHVAQTYGSAFDKVCSDARVRGFRVGEESSSTGKSDPSEGQLLLDAMDFQMKIDRAILDLAGFPHI